MAKKVFYDGKWRMLKDDGSDFRGSKNACVCDPPVEGRDEVWVPDGMEFRASKKSVREVLGHMAPPLPAVPRIPGTREYMVLSQRDESFMGNFEPSRLETRLNALGQEGWRVVTATTSDVQTWFGSIADAPTRQEMVILLERIVGEFEGSGRSMQDIKAMNPDMSGR